MDSPHVVAQVAWASPLDQATVECTCGIVFAASTDAEIAAFFSAHVRPYGRGKASPSPWKASPTEKRMIAQLLYEDIADRDEYDRG
jgi:hypothetical protein